MRIKCAMSIEYKLPSKQESAEAETERKSSIRSKRQPQHHNFLRRPVLQSLKTHTGMARMINIQMLRNLKVHLLSHRNLLINSLSF